MADRPPFFELHIHPMIRLLDRESMITVAGLDLWDYDQVKASADQILNPPLTDMPPVPTGGLGPEWISLLDRWKTRGFPRLHLASLNPPESSLLSPMERREHRQDQRRGARLDNGNDKAWLQPVIEEGKPRSYILYREPDTSDARPPGHNVSASSTCSRLRRP